MLPVLIVLAVGAYAWLYWRWSRTTLTRNCRWREDRRNGIWVCDFCGATTETDNNKRPRACLRNGG
ncbi:hypothetical protein SAMN04490244_103130 [Tranquillimonas rosea]|uniref:Uncharacterized protein n=1 Tax=Tranquillimonas rosea TaxID=641238 RepID=A0A1H9SBZ4_9RHOB|nr:hypothetical protein [Tranquillimonas rosea]SER82481.1 hypothetical protein SAMN04490244_103130 [Tranquillimonas rosea]